MSARLALPFALALAGCAPALKALDWKADPLPSVDCELVVTRKEAQGDFVGKLQYDADGRLVYARDRAALGAVASEHFTWTGDKLTRIDSYLDQPAWDGKCDSPGGCKTPPARIVWRVDVGWDKERLVSLTAAATLFAQRGDVWVEQLKDQESFTFSYDASGRLVGGAAIKGTGLASTGLEPFSLSWEGDRLARVNGAAVQGSVQDGAFTVGGPVQRRFSFKDGTLTREESQDAAQGKGERWTFKDVEDGAQLDRDLFKAAPGAKPTDPLSWEGWTETESTRQRIVHSVDALGSLVEIWGVAPTRTVSGKCVRRAEPRYHVPRNAFARLGAAACVQSPGGTFTRCFAP